MRNGFKILGTLAFTLFLCVSDISYCEEMEALNLMLSADEQIFGEDAGIKVKANKETLEKAQQAIDNKDFKTAIDLLSGYINLKSGKYEPYKLRGDAYYALRQYALAEKDYQTAVDIKASDDKLMTGTKYVSAIVLGADKNEQLQNAELGNLYARLMYAQKAQNNPAYASSFENAVKYNSHIYLPQPKKVEITQINCPQKYGKPLNPQGVDEDLYGAISEIEKENFNEALYKIQNVTSSYPDYYLGHYVTGVALAGLDKYDDAQHSFEKALSLNPNDFESYASLGQIYFEKAETTFSPDDAKKSVEYFQKALALNNNCYTYYFYIGLDNLQMGNTDLAISNFDSALKLNPNDYNSKYYKLIAQYNKGQYQAVADGASSLLLKHVSNYNSVLYLRALAYYKLNETDKALEDLNNVQNNIEDIYNADIKVVTDRDKALQSYIYYLKSEIAHSKGEGSASDSEKALQSPIIAQLVNAEKAVAPYEKVLNGENVTLEDYKKFEDFYLTSLPKLLNSGVVISSKDIDNQYDYIRTTFEDLGITFKYLNPDYKLTTIKDYPYKKYSSKLSYQDLATLSQKTPEEVKQSVSAVSVPQLKQSADKSELISIGGVSLAQMLASNELEARVHAENEAKKTLGQSLSQDIKSQEFKPETPDAETAKASSNIASGEPFVYLDKESPLVEEKNSKKVKEIIEEEKIIQQEEKGNVKISAKEIKQTPDIEIKYDKPAVVEKHANVNPADFGVQTKEAPVINSTEDVVFLDLDKNAKPEVDEVIQNINTNVALRPKAEVSEDEAEMSDKTTKEVASADIEQVNAEDSTQISDKKELNKKIKEEKAQAKADLKAQKEEAKAQAKAEAQQLKSERAKAKAELKAQKKALEEQAKSALISEAQKDEIKIENNIEQGKEEKESQKVTVKSEKQLQKAEAKAQAQQLKAERAQAKAELKAQKIAEKAVADAQKTEDNEVKVRFQKLKNLFKKKSE